MLPFNRLKPLCRPLESDGFCLVDDTIDHVVVLVIDIDWLTLLRMLKFKGFPFYRWADSFSKVGMFLDQ